jgi:hypothetical protein
MRLGLETYPLFSAGRKVTEMPGQDKSSVDPLVAVAADLTP